MPDHKSCEKRVRQTEKRTLANRIVKTKVKNTVKKFISENDKDKKSSLLKEVYRIYDKAVSKGVFKKNKAARTKSRLSRKLAD
ncbi:MAG: 30S ribosomal protein S20 [Proteobacteria bacterium]|nr:30S ribosomal protein S20 [Pseudomonadota bacterium]